MAKVFDSIVLGLGAMGSSAAYHLAGRGQKVLGLDQFLPGHDRGSSHGSTRVIRQTYYEDPAYVPLLIRAYELWRRLEAETGKALLFEVGGLIMGAENNEVFAGSLQSSLTYDLPHEVLDAKEIAGRYPVFMPGPEVCGLFEKRAGYVTPEACVQAHLNRAAQLGADLRFEEKVIEWTASPKGEGVCVKTTRGEYEAGRLIISPGAWAPQVLAESGLPFQVERQVLYWFEPKGGIEPFQPDRFPIFIMGCEDGAQPYGFPALDGPTGGVKVAFYRAPVPIVCTAEAVDRIIHVEEVETMRRAIARLIPALDSRCVKATTCLYTNTPDKNFILSRHPQHEQVFIGCGFSGHGFKFSSVIGEVLADLATGKSNGFDIDFLRPQRFMAGAI